MGQEMGQEMGKTTGQETGQDMGQEMGQEMGQMERTRKTREKNMAAQHNSTRLTRTLRLLHLF
jgi:hypothetical protein